MGTQAKTTPSHGLPRITPFSLTFAETIKISWTLPVSLSMGELSSNGHKDSREPFAWIPDEPWMEEAKCRGMNTEIFFGKEYHGRQRHRPTLTSIEIRRAKAICAVCPVLEECFFFAMQNDEEYGVWGGTTHRERQRLKESSPYHTEFITGSLSSN